MDLLEKKVILIGYPLDIRLRAVGFFGRDYLDQKDDVPLHLKTSRCQDFLSLEHIQESEILDDFQFLMAIKNP